MIDTPPETRNSLLVRICDPSDVEAWNDFASVYTPVIARVSRRFGLQKADVDNLVQEVFLAVAHNLSRWLERDDRGSFRAWLGRIARNEVIDLFRSRKFRLNRGNQSLSGSMMESIASHDNELDSMIEREYQISVFQWAAGQVQSSVHEKTWQAFWLTQVEGLSVEEAAEKLKVRRAHIYFARSRVMNQMKTMIAEFESES